MTRPEPTIVERTKPTNSEGDEDAVAHIVMKSDQMRGYASGQPIEALCGKVWVPSRDFEGLPVCQKCLDIKDRLLAGMKNLN